MSTGWTPEIWREQRLYGYVAVVREPYATYVHDGDTFTVDLDLGCDSHLTHFVVRPVGYNAPEITGAQKQHGLDSRTFLITLFTRMKQLHGAATVYIETIKNTEGRERRSGARYLARVLIEDNGDLRDLAEYMRAHGHHVD